jgi:muramidase (phage lysozyme)
MSDETDEKRDSDEREESGGVGAGPNGAAAEKRPGLSRNYVSFIGMAITVASATCIIFLFIFSLTGKESNPYLGIFTYILFPSIMMGGLAVIILGMLLERRRRRKLAPGEAPRYPSFDFNDPRRRRNAVGLLAATFVFLCASAVGSYHAFEYTESVQFCGQVCHTVMKPEFTAYKASPHSRVACVECHVGPGADWYVKSKISGAYQLYSVTFNKYPRPIKTPVHDLRPAQQTCEQCHWPEKFFGGQLKVFNRYGYDEKNTVRQTRLLINTGGGSPVTGQVAGIHWHMNIANEVTYINTDEQRQVIPWVRMRNRNTGEETVYTLKDAPLSAQRVAETPKRTMDCVDCHNRPSHIYVQPDRAVNDAFTAGRLDPSMPYLKRQAVEVLSANYETTDEAVAAIGKNLEAFYRQNYPDVYSQKTEAVRGAVAEVQRIYQTYFFPEMKTDWRTHPNNVGHYYSQGCFRCHDGQHASDTGRLIRNDCNICHTTLDQTDNGRPVAITNGEYKHPVELGGLANMSCTACHKYNRAFRRPVNLGDLSQFKCADCHSGKNWTLEGD